MAPQTAARQEVSREVLSWPDFGRASRELAARVADGGFRPDMVLAVARGGLTVAGALAYALSVKNCFAMNVEFHTGIDERQPHVADARGAVLYQKPRSEVDCEYVWSRTDLWIDFPWSSDPPVLDPASRAW